MGAELTYEGLKFEKGSVTSVTDPLIVEQPLQININGSPFTVVMQTPGAEKELVFGLLYGEDVLKRNAGFTLKETPNARGYVEQMDVIVDPDTLGSGYLSSRSLLSVSSCGICGKQELGALHPGDSAIESEDKLHPDALFQMHQMLFDKQTLFKHTGGCHGVAAFDIQGKLLALFEDVGRHNALDKVIGKLLFDKSLEQAHVIAFSGRISYEIVSKSFRAKIPVIVAVSAASSLAVDFAKEFGITLLAFARNGKATCYAHPHRLIT